MPDDPTDNEKTYDALTMAFGDALAQWAAIEAVLGLYFRKIALLPTNEMATAIFFSARSFSGRAEMLDAALQHTGAPSAYKAWVEDLLAKAIKYNSCRNHLAHGFPHLDSGSISSPKQWWAAGTIDIASINTAARNFSKLRKIAVAGFTGEQLRECHERLAALANDPYSSEPSRKQKGRLRQLLADARRATKNSPQG